jgi:hypothetical protein
MCHESFVSGSLDGSGAENPNQTTLYHRLPSPLTESDEKLWIYLRTNQHFTLKEKTLKRSDLDEFVGCFYPENRHERTESERFRCFPYDELLKRDKVISTSFGSKTSHSKTVPTFLIQTCSRWKSPRNSKQRWNSLRRSQKI